MVFTPEQYLEIERRAEVKSAYYGGEMFAMAGASRKHSRVAGNLYVLIGLAARGTGCEYFPSEMRLHVPATGLYTYPDLSVVCGEPQFLDGFFDTLLNPAFLVEVLSPSTEAFDRGRKFEHYQSIESLKEYMTVAQDRVRVDLYTRQPQGGWLLTHAASLAETVELKSIGCQLQVAEVYERVRFDDQE